MFPIKGTGIARHWSEDPRKWVGIAVFVYPDQRVVEEVVEAAGATDQPMLFSTEAEAAKAAEAHAQTFRISNRTEVLTGLYGGES